MGKGYGSAQKDKEMLTNLNFLCFSIKCVKLVVDCLTLWV